MKKISSFLPVFAIVLGAGLVFTQSAFKQNTNARYGYDSTYGWINVDNLKPGDSYLCNMNPPTSETCTEVYTGIPGEPGSTVVPDSEEKGVFIYEPAPEN